MIAGGDRRASSPCLRHGCHACCIDTNMSLTSADVVRLERAGARDFYRTDDDGHLRLRTRNNCCVFLTSGVCSVYADRPEGCVLYPLIYFVDCDEVGLHDFCPFRHEFTFSEGDQQWLRRSLAREEAEAEERRRTG